MSGVTREDLLRLAEPIPWEEIEWRAASQGMGRDNRPWCKILPYINNRTVMERLDHVVGPENWKDEFLSVPGGFMCGISVRVGDEWITKWDGAADVQPQREVFFSLDFGVTGTLTGGRAKLEEFSPTDEQMLVKAGISDAEKRAATKWGMGRELYRMGEHWGVVEGVEKRTPGAKRGWIAKEKAEFWWLPPPKPEGDSRPDLRRGEEQKPKFPTKPPQKSGGPTTEFDEFAGYVKARLEGDGQKLWGKSSEGAWTGFRLWVTTEKVGDFGSWPEIEACTDKARLRSVWEAFLSESQRRQDGEFPY